MRPRRLDAVTAVITTSLKVPVLRAPVNCDGLIVTQMSDDGPITSPAIELVGQVELPRLVDLASLRNGLAIQYDGNTLNGSLTQRLGVGMPDNELWPLANRVLPSQGFATVRLLGDRAYSVVHLAAASRPLLSKAGFR